MKPLSENNFANNAEHSLLKSCSEFNITYIKPTKNENQQQCRNRRQKISRHIEDAKLKNKSNKSQQDISHIEMEQSLLKSCSKFGVKYSKPSKNENRQQCRNRRRKIRRHLADAQELQHKINNPIQHQHTNAAVQQHKDTIATLPNTDNSVNTTNASEPCVKNNLQQEPTTPENVNTLKEETFASGKIREIFGRNFREFRELANFGFFARIIFREFML